MAHHDHRRPYSCPTVGTVLALLALGPAAADGEPVHDLVGAGIVQSFASAGDREVPEPSVSLIGILLPIAPAPAGFGPLPSFGAAPGFSEVVVPVEPGTNLYGTGFQSGPLERAGRRVEFYNLDNFGWGDASNRSYQTHPWVLGVRADGSAFGVLFDSTWASVLDLTDPLADGIVFQTEGPPPRVITIDAASPQDVVMTLSELTGRPFMPPMWSVGYHQSKYSYTPQSSALGVAQEFRARGIPADTLWLDIDYMDGFRNFTFNTAEFPDPSALNADLDDIGFSAVWMANCGIKVDPFYDAYQEMVALDLAVKRGNRQTDFIGEVWPGLSVWPDYTMQATRDWWAGRIADFAASIGVDGIWNDMNEPAVFNVQSKTMPDNNWHRADADLGGPDVHRRYHNIYGMQMSRATRLGMLMADPDARPFVLTRAGFIGGQRYAAMWTGDNVANWYHVGVSIQNVLNIGLSGQPNCGPDIGGFNGDSGADMYARWMGIGALMPFARGHYGFSSLDREPWSYGTDTEDTSRLALQRRYRLLNYIYTQFYTAHTTGLPVCRPLFFAETDNAALREWEQGFLIGDGLLVVAAPFPGAVPQRPPMHTPVYRFSFPQDIPAGSADDSLDPDLPDLYALGGHIIVANEPVQHSREIHPRRDEPIELIVALDAAGNAAGTLYEDDGSSFDYETGAYALTRYVATRSDGLLRIDREHLGGSLPLLARDVTVRVLMGGGGEISNTLPSALFPIIVPIPEPTPDAQPLPSLRDGRLVADALGRRNKAGENRSNRFSERSQLRSLHAVADERGLRVHMEGELAIDGTALALFIDAEPGGQDVLDTSPLFPPPSGLQALTGTAFDEGFEPEHMLFMNAFEGSIFCDWLTLESGAPATKTYLGRGSLGSGEAALTQGSNPLGIEVALGSAGPAAGSGFEILIPDDAIGRGNGATNRVRLFAAVVKTGGAITNQTLPTSGRNWPGFAPDFAAVPGRQHATVARAFNADADADGSVDIEDAYALAANPADINSNGAIDGDDVRTLAERTRTAEVFDMLTR